MVSVGYEVGREDGDNVRLAGLVRMRGRRRAGPSRAGPFRTESCHIEIEGIIARERKRERRKRERAHVP